MYVILYQAEGAEPEVFGPYATPTQAASALRHITTAAGQPLDVSHSALLATIELDLAGERHRYHLLKVGSTTQLEVHGQVIREVRAEHEASVALRDGQPTPTRLSGY